MFFDVVISLLPVDLRTISNGLLVLVGFTVTRMGAIRLMGTTFSSATECSALQCFSRLCAAAIQQHVAFTC